MKDKGVVAQEVEGAARRGCKGHSCLVSSMRRYGVHEIVFEWYHYRIRPQSGFE